MFIKKNYDAETLTFLYISAYLEIFIQFPHSREKFNKMCILMATRSHPEYDLVLISNRDEFFARKTGSTCWNHDEFILRPIDESLNTKGIEGGTWLGLNKDGRIASILNLKLLDDRREARSPATGSRGTIPISFLSDRESKFGEWDDFSKFKRKYPSLETTGDFNLFYGNFRESEYRVIDSMGDTYKVLDDSCNHGFMVLSNDIYKRGGFENGSWGKVRLAHEGLQELVLCSKGKGEETVISECFALASKCPFGITKKNGEFHMNPLELTMNTIFTPPLKVSADDELGTSMPIGEYYGTRSQIVVLVNKDRTRVKYVERIIHSSDKDIEDYNPAHPIEENRFELDLTKV